jgi:phosphoenolpyruvate-protein phosphotransferase
MGLEGLVQAVRHGMPVILDSNSQLIYLNPDAHVVREYRRIIEGAVKPKIGGADSLSTIDGQSIQLLGNVSLLSDLDFMERVGLKAVGLYRSEFFFMIRNEFPTEDAQAEVYQRIASRAVKHEVTIRILDVGGDKPLRYFNFGREENPALGWRSIRMLMEREDILQPHLKALLRAAQGGNVRLLVPMITLLSEFRAMKVALQTASNELTRETGNSFLMPPLGVMVEIPSALLQIEDIAREADFLCIGTNDLIQYLFAIDRGNERVARYFHPYHPTFLRAMRTIREAADKHGKSVTVCGEMAADPEALPLLLGLGLTKLSIAPGAADSVRETVAALNYGKCRRLVDRLLVKETEFGLKGEVESALAAAMRDL